MSETRRHTTATAGISNDVMFSKTRFWWLLLITGIAWIVLSVVILRFDYTTVAAVAVLFGVYCLVAAATQTMVGAVSSSTGWRIVHGLLAALLVVAGVVSFANFGATFDTLTAIISFYFIVRGCVDIVTAFAANVLSGWWVLLICGFIELGLGFWAAGCGAPPLWSWWHGWRLRRSYTASATLPWASRSQRTPRRHGRRGLADRVDITNHHPGVQLSGPKPVTRSFRGGDWL